MIGPHFHGLVNAHHIADTFIKRKNRFIDHRQQNAIDDKGRKIFRHTRGLADIFDNLLGRFKGFIAGGNAANDFHQLHHRHRIHEMHADKLFRSVGRSRQTGNGN